MDGTIFHGDRGAESTSAACWAAFERLGLSQSAGKTGLCLDNAVAEDFFASLKVELVNRYRFAARAEARQAISAWIVRYSNRRLRSTLGFMPPIEWQQRHRSSCRYRQRWPQSSGVRPPGDPPRRPLEARSESACGVTVRRRPTSWASNC